MLSHATHHTHRNMDEPQNAGDMKEATKSYTLNDLHLYERSQMGKSTEKESR